MIQDQNEENVLQTQIDSPDLIVSDWKQNGKFYNATGYQSIDLDDIVFSKQRKPGRPKVVLVHDKGSDPEREYRVKVWFDNSNEGVLKVNFNGVSLYLESLGNYLYQGYIGENKFKQIRFYRHTKSVIVDEAISFDEDMSPIIVNARSKAYDEYKKKGKPTTTYYFYRSVDSYLKLWRSTLKSSLEEQIKKERSKLISKIAEWESILNWWDRYVVIDKNDYQEEKGFSNWEDYFALGHGSAELGEFKPGIQYYKPKELYKSDCFPIKYISNKIEADIGKVSKYISKDDYYFLDSIAKVHESLGLKEVYRGSALNDGFMWFKNENGILFPFRLMYVHWPQCNINYKIGQEAYVNELMLKYFDVETNDQNKAWYALTNIVCWGGHRVNADWDVRNHMKSFLGKYTGLNVHYKKILKYVKKAAEKNPPPLNLPGV